MLNQREHNGKRDQKKGKTQGPRSFSACVLTKDVMLRWKAKRTQ